MKPLMLAVCAVAIIAGTIFYLAGTKTTPPPVPESPAQTAAAQAADDALPGVEKPHHPATGIPGSNGSAGATSTPPARTPYQAIASARLETATLEQAVDTLVSPQANHAQRQAVWKQLREGGRLDAAITELERRTTTEPRDAGYPAALGQAYLQKCSTIQDMREQGVLALQADKLFDNALSLDPSNWEARFTKAVALTYWPASMNKGEEIIQHFQTLIQQQEAQSPQPQFADTYALLGDQFQKAGQNDDARSIWQRGAALFPNNEKLNQKLGSAQ